MPQGQFFVDLAYLFNLDETTCERVSEDHRRTASDLLDTAFDAGGTELPVSITNRHSSLYATAGYPALTVPLGRRANGRPVGVTFLGHRGDDARLVASSHAFEQATGWRVPPPLGSDT